MHKVFISYNHRNDSQYRDKLIEINSRYHVFIDRSVDTGDIDERLPDETIRELIRDGYLRDSTVTILLVGHETKGRKHIDWEIYSSMHDGTKNKKSGILVVNLPSAASSYFDASHVGEKKQVYPDVTSWTTIDSRAEYERRYPLMPARIIDNLLKPEAKVSVVPWERVEQGMSNLQFLIGAAHADKALCEYDLSRPMRRAEA